MSNPKPLVDLLLRGVVVSMNAERDVWWDGFVAVTDGKIVDAGDASACQYEASEVVGGADTLIIPGLVNTHDHLVQGCMRGMAEGTTFQERLFGFYYPMTAACDEERSYWSALSPLVDLALSGVTTVADDHFTHLHKDSMDGVFRAIDTVGLRARVSRLVINEPGVVPENLRETIDTGLAETERLRKRWQSPLVNVTAGTVGITYVDPGDLHQLFDWTIANGEQFDIHVPSMMDKVYLEKRRGWSGGSFEWLDHEGMLGPNVIGIHAQRLAPGEHALVGERGASVSMVADMEALLGLVQFDAGSYLKHGATVSLGLDGPVVSYGQNLWHTMKSLMIAQRLHDAADRLINGDRDWDNNLIFGSAEQALELATIGGAKALMMDDRVGSLEPGKDADAVVIDLSRQTTLAPYAGLIPNLVYSGGPTAEALTRVLVRGKAVVVDGSVVGIDKAQAVRQAEKAQRDLLEETGCGSYVRKGSPWNWHGAPAAG
jgi:5-methylthioadenosine/S-adenosylhomocysteine deaminase